MAKSLLILTQYFPPETGAPQARLSEISLNLKEFGWEVEVLTAFPNYPAGKIFEDYRGKWFLIEDFQGIRVLRTFILPTKSTNIVKRLLCYFSFIFSSYLFGKKYCKKPDLIYVESPPLFIYYSVSKLSKYFKVPYVLNLSDLWPDVFVTLGRIKKDSIYYRLMKNLEKKAYKNALGITCQTEGILRGVNSLEPDKKKKLIPNGIEIHKFGKNYYSENLRKEMGWDEKYVFIYTGLFGVSQGLEQILEVADLLKDKKEILFSLIGDGPEKEKIENLVKSKGIYNVQILPLQPRERIPYFLASADVAIIPLIQSIPEAVPSKTYEAMGSGLPLLVISEGEVSNIVKKAQAGIVCSPGKIDEIKNAGLSFINNKEMAKEMGERGRRFVVENFNRKKISADLKDFFEGLLKG